MRELLGTAKTVVGLRRSRTFAIVLYEIAERLRGVQIECDDALVVIERYDSPQTFFYCDPPYPAETRGRWKTHAYAHEMTGDQHRELAYVLANITGMALISGYRCELYDELYAGWRRADRVARVNGPGSAIESLWISPRADGNRQLYLFA
jgi:DNA adenine methylase